MLTRQNSRFASLVVVLGLIAAACGGTSTTNTVGDEPPSSALSFVDETTTTTESAPADRIVVAARGSIDASPMWVAESEGFFADENLDIDFAPGLDEASLFEALVLGNADVAVVSTASAVRRAMFDGDELEFLVYLDGTVGGVDDVRGTMSLLSSDPTLSSGCALEGKRIGVESLHSLTAVAVREMVKRDSCNPALVEFDFGDATTHLRELKTGDIDASALIDPYTARALRAGHDVVANLDQELCPDYGRCPISMVVASRDWAETNPDVAQRLQKSLDAAMFWIRQNELDYRAELVSCCALTPDDASDMVVPDFVGNRRTLDGDLPRLLDILRSQGQATPGDLGAELER